MTLYSKCFNASRVGFLLRPGQAELSGERKSSEIKFNLSRSSDLALLVVSQHLVLGVDVEGIKPEVATEEIAEHFFCASEVSAVRALSGNQRAEVFFSCWTRKEAYLKAIEEGFSMPMDSFAVSVGASCPSNATAC